MSNDKLGLDKSRLDELRPLVEATPEGHVARALLTMIDEELADRAAISRAQTIQFLQREQGRTEEEAAAITDLYERTKTLPEEERVTCWECNGREYVLGGGGCMGGSEFVKCSTCHGRGKASRYKVPD